MIAMPSVSRAPGTVCSTAVIVAISVGAIAKPATKSAIPMPTIDPMKDIGTITRASTTAPIRTRSADDRVHRNVPVIRPASTLPSAHAASSTPAYGLAPCSAEKATVLTSAAANIDPSAKETVARATTGTQGIGGRGPESGAERCGVGSVLRCIARASEPNRPVTRPSPSADQGCHWSRARWRGSAR